jgi:hypothetical protein
LLTRYAIRQDPAVEPHLARWLKSELDVTILETGDAQSDVQDVIARLDDTAHRIGRHISYCIQPLRVASNEAYSPKLPDVSCLKHQSDVLILVDNSPIPSRVLYGDLLLRAMLPEEVAFWDARAEADASAFQKTSCEERMNVGGDSWEFSAATAYLRIVDRGISYRSCMRVLAYLIFGQRPVKRANGRQDLIPEMLELLYSSDLSSGMSREQITMVLDR